MSVSDLLTKLSDAAIEAARWDHISLEIRHAGVYVRGLKIAPGRIHNRYEQIVTWRDLFEAKGAVNPLLLAVEWVATELELEPWNKH